MSGTDKIRENRIRRAAQRQGLALMKSRRRDERAYDYGTYMLIDAQTNAVVAYRMQSGYGMNLDDIETALTTTNTAQEETPMNSTNRGLTQQLGDLLRCRPADDAPEHVKTAWLERKRELLAAVEAVQPGP